MRSKNTDFTSNQMCIGYILVVNFITFISDTPDCAQRVRQPSSQRADNRCINKNTLSLKQNVRCLYIIDLIHCLYIKHPAGICIFKGSKK